MKGLFLKLTVLAPMLIGLPLAGVWLSGGGVAKYLQLPPETVAADPPGFSLEVFVALLALVVAVVGPFAVRLVRSSGGVGAPAVRRFPVWGWAGLAFGLVMWVLAWTRMDWFSPLQMHTFTPLWMAYIIVVNGLTWRRTGGCMMLDRPGFFLALFPISAVFWWFFEYLNRFVQNWHYLGGVQDMSALQYVVFASAPFATVLPAVLGTREWLATYPVFDRAFASWTPLTVRRPRVVGAGVLVGSAAGLAGIAMWPNVLFPLLWVSPLLIVIGLQMLGGEAGVFAELSQGDWRRVATAALAALICGFFWEMWNVWSEAKWVYQVPYVQAGRLFEMPLLGYSGYLPFGLECLVIGDLVARKSVLTLARGRAITTLVSSHSGAGKPAECG